ncbi:hypothetical protein HJG40_03430 [Acidithiobacillus sp. ATCC 19703]|uniref:Uncharacterized protein n=1 Tax=Acidithiobacillus concretivorus TaxID=3063952 RepID=A0ABS5ZML1_9PROT|nr:hypothetical protein [Acidithiobacillus concretivorus]
MKLVLIIRLLAIFQKVGNDPLSDYIHAGRGATWHKNAQRLNLFWKIF